MGTIVQTDISCDINGKRCLGWVYGGLSSNKAEVRVARQFARRDGWIRKFNKELRRWEDICPKCQKELSDG